MPDVPIFSPSASRLARTICVLAKMDQRPWGNFLYPLLTPFPPPKTEKKKAEKKEKTEEKEAEFPSIFPIAPLFLFRNKEFKKKKY